VKGFKTLFWLELRRSGVWALALIGSLAFWAWGLQQALAVEGADPAEAFAVLFVLSAAIGALVLALMVGRLRGESRGGQLQVLLLTPPSGATHLASRFAFGVSVACAYYVILGGLGWWVLAATGFSVTAGSVAQLVLGIPLYAVGVAIAPLLAWTLLLMVFVSAYRISGTGWIPGTVMVLGTPFALRWLVEEIGRASYSLPGWPILGGLGQFGTIMVASPDGSEVEAVRDGVLQLPQEPLWIMLALTVVLLVVASRIWREVEA
jgi:hypothetical protein